MTTGGTMTNGSPIDRDARRCEIRTPLPTRRSARRSWAVAGDIPRCGNGADTPWAQSFRDPSQFEGWADILRDGYKTGADVSGAIIDGGPYPAASEGRTAPVAKLAFRRFRRHVCSRDAPEALLPPVLRDGERGEPRRVGGVLTLAGEA